MKSVYHKKKNLTQTDIDRGYVEIDFYEIAELYELNHRRGHAVKKLLMAGERHDKSLEQDLSESIKSIQSELELL